MGEYRNRTTGEIKTQGELRRDNPNMSMPRVWGDNVHDALNVDPIFAVPKPTEGIGQYQFVARNGVVQDAKDNWVEAWEIRDMFADTTDEDGKKTTKSEHEKAYQTQLDTDAAESNRRQRDKLIAETDWWASCDLTITDAQKKYRQDLRDITKTATSLDDVTWPTKP